MAHDAAYYRAYRARLKGRPEVAPEPVDPPEARLRSRILELEEEVRHLKAELARRPSAAVAEHGQGDRTLYYREPTFNSRPFTPVPKR